METSHDNENIAVHKFREYLRIKTVHPNPDYDSAVKFLEAYAGELDFDVRLVAIGQDKMIVLMTIPGKNPDLSSILLNSHMDVVPVFENDWTYDPFAAHKDTEGNIYGRGAQDMKCVGIQYLEALRILIKSKNEVFERTIHVTFVPDEEINDGTMGMKLFLDTPEFRALNVGLALDEGLANPENKYSIFYGERGVWAIRIKCQGNPGHGSRFIENTAAKKLQTVITNFLEYRTTEELRLKNDPSLTLGDVTTVNLTMLEGGVQPNVVPGEFAATFDIRIPPSVDLKEFESKISAWCHDEGVTIDFMYKATNQSTTVANETNPWWHAFTSTFIEKKMNFSKEIFSGGTDGNFLREQGYPVIGFSPMRNTPILLHDNDEYLNEKTFLEGVDIYCSIISSIANLKF